MLDVFYDKLKDALEKADLDQIIIISVDTSMPAMVRFVKQFKMPAPKIPEEGNVIHWKTFAATGDSDPETTYTARYGENDCVAITMTGGTTGLPKGVMLSNDGFNAVAVSFEYCGVNYTRDQRFLDIIPMFASYGIVASLHMPLYLGLELVVIPKFDAEKVGHYIKKYKPAHTLMVPAHYEKLMNSKEMKNGFDLSFFETAGTGGDTMNAGTEAKLNGFLKEHGGRFPLSQGYGMSEVSSAASCYCNGHFRSLSVGYPILMNTISIFKPETDEELGYDVEGEICMTGPSNMLGYLNQQMTLPIFLEPLEQWMKTAEENAALLTEQFLSVTTISGLIINILLMALLPAVSEELTFRGVLQRLFQAKGERRETRDERVPHTAIWCSAILFSAIHMQFYGFLPRMLMGALFGYMLVWTGSLLVPILMHFTNNSMAVILYFVALRADGDMDKVDAIGTNDTLWLGVVSLILTIIGIYIFRRSTTMSNASSRMSNGN